MIECTDDALGSAMMTPDQKRRRLAELRTSDPILREELEQWMKDNIADEDLVMPWERMSEADRDAFMRRRLPPVFLTTEAPTPSGTVRFSTAFLQQQNGGRSPVGLTFTFDVGLHGKIYTFSGVPAVVDGDETSFVLDDSNLVGIKPA